MRPNTPFRLRPSRRSISASRSSERPPRKPPAWAEGLDPSSFGIKLPPKPTDYEIAELVLHAGARVNQFEEKAAFVPVPDLYHLATPAGRRQTKLLPSPTSSTSPPR